MNTRTKLLFAGATALAVAMIAATDFTAAAPVPLSQLEVSTHIHGLVISRTDPAKLLIATHHGLYQADADGNAQLISEVQDFMGFNAHPVDPDVLYASGHPVRGGNLGFIASQDGGKTWRQISPGVDGPVDFHQMTVSSADPSRIYGAYGAIQVSEDGGQTWSVAGPAPERLIDLAASSIDPDKLFAATETGLRVSTDAGKTWTAVLEGNPVTMVEVAPGGAVYAFILGEGLMRSDQEDPLELEPISDTFGEAHLRHLAIDPSNPDRLFAATSDGDIVQSSDRGITWSAMAS